MSEKDDINDYLSRLEAYEVPQKQSKEAIWEHVEARTFTPGEGRIRKLHPALAVAAGIVLLAGIYLLLRTGNIQTFRAPAGEQITQTLTDDSQVYLNAGSTLTFRKAVLGGHRRVTLQGEAFFEVRRGGNFIVEADALTVKVTGTKFNIRVRGNSYSVTCYAGSVGVIASGHEPRSLAAGQQLKLHNGVLQISRLETKDTTADWMQGRFRFRKVPLQEVWNVIQRQFAVEIRFIGDSARLYTGSFSNDSLQKALDKICKPMNLKYRIDSQSQTVSVRPAE